MLLNILVPLTTFRSRNNIKIVKRSDGSDA
jgi:hypothetical protein